MKLSIQPGTGHKKYKAVFTSDDGSKKSVSFGDNRYQDYTQHHSKDRRLNYLRRHEPREDWEHPDNAGSLSAWLLWGEHTSFDKNLAEFKKYFSLG